MTLGATHTKRSLLRDLRGWLATGLGSGLAPKAPGTVGTIACLPIWFFLGQWLPWFGYLMALIALFCIGCWSSQWVIAELKTDDPGCIVIDEWVGMGITWAAIAYWPQPQPHALLFYVLPAFIVFRVCDIFKFWPASWADRNLDGGFGAMVDDVLAGIWSLLLMLAALWVLAPI